MLRMLRASMGNGSSLTIGGRKNMNRALHYLTALIWAAVAYWLFVMHMLGRAIAGIPSALFGFDSSIASRARDQIYGREFSWFAFGSLIAFGIAVACVVTARKKPIQTAQSTPGLTFDDRQWKDSAHYSSG
jgi:hypothetical protein